MTKRKGEARVATRARWGLTLIFAGGVLLAACGGTSSGAGAADAGVPSSSIVEGAARTFRVDAWADNWFAMYSGETLVGEDSVAIATPRSFNKETFTFNGGYPLMLNFVLKDFKEDDSGLEYIGLPNQQMGDGGFIVQITDTTTGKVVGASGTSWRCLVIHKAPLDVGCEKSSTPAVTCTSAIVGEPANWKRADYDPTAWEQATSYTSAEVGPKDGYTEIAWDSSASLVWTSSLKQDNTLLCKYTVAGP